MKKIKLNITRDDNNLENNIYYVCEKNILISNLTLTINYDENNIQDEQIIDENEFINQSSNNIDNNEVTEDNYKSDINNNKNKILNIKISFNDESLNNLYMNNIIYNLYDYIFENKINNVNINKNHKWNIFINIYVYEYTPYIYDHICNVINVHLSILLFPLCFYDFDSRWYRCIENFEELYKHLVCTNNKNGLNETLTQQRNNNNNNNNNNDDDVQINKCTNHSICNNDKVKTDDIYLLDKYEQNKNIIINQIENTNFDLFIQIKNNELVGFFKRLLINFIPIINTVNIEGQFIYLIKYLDYKHFFLNTKQNAHTNEYHNINNMHTFLNFKQYTSFQNVTQNDYNNDLDNNNNNNNNTHSEYNTNNINMNENYYILFNAATISFDEQNILTNSKDIIQFYYNFILNYAMNYYLNNYLK
ncbi:hypothetical protein PFMG_02806 [Plasmodium falciparum IGH-CR14]|uniref:Uncharacterized protein n=3 Tax=Plasmodium falciparum TaxID=5833 RepID=C6KT98_PLAF7|nr:conserved Plasmodium protein, unknown function [Plasmodium falciparum 3D7]EWC86078.1 hypothetical protein PFNF54_05182 [Plasmodium falciparum NF54]KNG76672.1 hypothetical protein PFMG_02806 [Plasmodium falciparum IGH-CR14]KAF4327748.1 hypothetical protein CYL21_4403 [Plasmodium falciparum NF54]PKC42780.1 hypothetical protein CK202_5124 [Plasmodium falciparum NF54]CAG25075.1 conserved Plasmodium protein, unknown function [Plasmodium falciparum 3D7]|eukprot:XP_966245.1 conserved Plasmodium protein, unknown function [Plasmodium falciparum 3D7]